MNFLKLIGKGYAKAVARKKPNKELYEIKDKVTITCHAENTDIKDVYDIKWYKSFKNGQFKELKAEEGYVNGMWSKTLALTELSERDEAIYKCIIYRTHLQYSAKKLVKIYVRGKPDDLCRQIMFSSVEVFS